MKKEKIEQFFIIWGIVLLLNQIFIFGGCFAAHCIGSALPHTALIAFLWMYFTREEDDSVSKNDDISSKTKTQRQKHNRKQTGFTKKSKEHREKDHTTQTDQEKDKRQRAKDHGWNDNFSHAKTKVNYKKFEFDINGWSTEKVYLSYCNTDEYINIYTGDKYSKNDVDYYGKKKNNTWQNKQEKKKSKAKAQYTNTQRASRNQKQKEQSFTKKLGDEYEKYIGRKFEEKGDLVIYNGFIKGYEDKGVDIISISEKTKTINLIQCKNWKQKPMVLDDVENIFYKLGEYELDFFDIDIDDINKHLSDKRDDTIIKNLFLNIKFNHESYQIRKILYASSDKVIDLQIGNYLTMIKPDIFRYEDMKIVIHRGD